MSEDSIRLNLPLSCLAARDCEAGSLYGELRTPLMRYLMCLGLSRDESQDVVQDAFLSLHRYLSGGGQREDIRSWLFRVAHNQARNRQNSYARRNCAPLEPGTEMISERATPERLVLEKEKLRRLQNAIAQLSGPERECIFLRAEGLRYREIGAVLGLATSTVADMVDRTIRKLAERCNV
jgi:RNA polymerase sigma-70 factor, ECF subfamily